MEGAVAEIVDEEVEHRGGDARINVRLEQSRHLLVDALADGTLAEAVAAGDVERGHQGFAVGEHTKGQQVDAAGTHRIQLTGVREHDGQHTDALEQVEHAKRIGRAGFGTLHEKPSFAPDHLGGG